MNSTSVLLFNNLVFFDFCICLTVFATGAATVASWLLKVLH